MRAGVLTAAATLLLAACGQKGPLYLPDHKPAVVRAPAPAAASPAADTTANPPAPKKKTDEDTSDVPAPK